MTEPQQHSAPSRLVQSDRFSYAYDDQLERQARLEQKYPAWLSEFHKRFGAAPR